MNNKYFIGYDVLKLIFSLFIIAIHVSLLNPNSNNFSFFVVKCLFRLAVPSFFAISGFLYERKVYNLNKLERKIVTFKYVKGLLIPFIFWLIIDMPLKYLEMRKVLSISSTIKEMIKWLFFYQWGALWYISALIIAILLIYFLRKKIHINEIFIISVPLYMFALLSNNYYFIVKNTFFGKIILKYRNIFISERNGIFEGLLFVSLGMIIYKYYCNNKIKYKRCLTNIIIIYLIFIAEVFLLRNKISLPDGSLYIVFIALIPLIVAFFTKFTIPRKNIIFRRFSTGFYFLHYPIIRVIDLISSKLNYTIQPFICFTLVVLISAIIIAACHLLNNEKINKILL